MDSSSYYDDCYIRPEWSEAGRVHDWRNYINDEVRAMWDTFTSEQKAALARQADDMAGNENWD